MKVYIVTSKFDDTKFIEKVFLKQTDAKDFCFEMNMQYGWRCYGYIEEEVIE